MAVNRNSWDANKDSTHQARSAALKRVRLLAVKSGTFAATK